MARRRKRTHGAGTVIPPKMPGGPWAIRYRDGGKKCYRSGFESKEMAERVLTMMAGEAVQGRSLLPADPKDSPILSALVEDFLKSRDLTHAAASTDRNRWKNHLAPFFGHLRPGEVTKGHIKKFIEGQLRDKLNPATIRIHVALLSSLYVDLMERTPPVATHNPALQLPKGIRRLVKPTYDSKTTPFIEKLADVQRIYALLPEPMNVAYAIGVLAGLRTGEVFGLDWSHVDLSTRRIHVRQQTTREKGVAFKTLKDKDSRIVPVMDSLEPVLKAWKLKSGGEGLVIPAMRKDGTKVAKATPGRYLSAVLAELKLNRPGLAWYECTRHTFASHWVMNGGSIEKLKEILGHYSVVMTEKYSHLKPELFTPKDLGTIPLELRAASNAVPVPIGQTLDRLDLKRARKSLKSK